MKGLKIFLFVTVSCFIAAPLYADIYEWTDQNGVKHFTNYTPPADATILIKTEELPYDEAADRERIEAERRQQQELARLEIAEKEAEIERRAAEADRKAAEADRYSEEVRQQADNYLEEAKNDRRYYRSYGYFGYYRRPHYYLNPYKRHYSKRNNYGHSGKKLHYKYKQKEHFSRKGHETKRSLRYRGKNNHRASRIGWRGKGYHGRATKPGATDEPNELGLPSTPRVIGLHRVFLHGRDDFVAMLPDPGLKGVLRLQYYRNRRRPSIVWQNQSYAGRNFENGEIACQLDMPVRVTTVRTKGLYSVHKNL